MRMTNHFRPGTPLFIRVLSSRSLRAITAYYLFARFTFKNSASKLVRNTALTNQIASFVTIIIILIVFMVYTSPKQIRIIYCMQQYSIKVKRLQPIVFRISE